jgi:ABC-type uncharacterized transport system fused permease/ATPase subunit
LADKRELDNPDQRMTADVDLLCRNYGSIIADLVSTLKLFVSSQK